MISAIAFLALVYCFCLCFVNNEKDRKEECPLHNEEIMLDEKENAAFDSD